MEGRKGADADERVGGGVVDEDGVDTSDQKKDEAGLGGRWGEEGELVERSLVQLFDPLITHQFVSIYGIAPAFPDLRVGAQADQGACRRWLSLLRVRLRSGRKGTSVGFSLPQNKTGLRLLLSSMRRLHPSCPHLALSFVLGVLSPSVSYPVRLHFYKSSHPPWSDRSDLDTLQIAG